jgi:hypothetical protein
MDIKQAISAIRNNWPPSNYTMLREALEMSIKSLEAAEYAQTAHNNARDEILPLLDEAISQVEQFYKGDFVFKLREIRAKLSPVA